MHESTLAEHIKALRTGTYSSVELTQHYLNRINALDKGINSFITVCDEQALAQAAEADKRLSAGSAPLLCGIPVAHKDLFCTEGVRTSCGSKMLDNFKAPYNATIVENTLAEGMVMLGKTNMDEFAMGSSNESSFYGDCANPWQRDRVAGGSSGGSAAAVAAGFAPVASASDTGGSIRQPASFCGITGIKPTYGRVSRWGMVAYASSFDQAGSMGRTAEDAALLLNVLSSIDPKDSTNINRPLEDYTASLNEPLKGLTIGLPKEYFDTGLDQGVAQQVEAAIEQYQSLGATIKSITLPHTNLAIAAYYVLASAECSSNLSRFDGARFGHRCDNPEDLLDMYRRSRAEGFGKEVQCRILVGTYALSAGYYDAYYRKAQQVRRLIAQDFEKAFSEVDVIAGPTAPNVAFGFGEKTSDPVAMYLEDIYTISANLAGIPGLSHPCGFSQGLPVGLQLMGPHFSEAKLLNCAHQYQQVTDFHRQMPELLKEEIA